MFLKLCVSNIIKTSVKRLNGTVFHMDKQEVEKNLQLLEVLLIIIIEVLFQENNKIISRIRMTSRI